MESNTTKNYFYTGNYYSYTLVTSADELVTTREYTTIPQQVALALSVNLLGELVIETPYKMQLDGYLKNVLDRNNEEIYVGGVWQIIQTAPILGALGVKDGYRYRARLIDGAI